MAAHLPLGVCSPTKQNSAWISSEPCPSQITPVELGEENLILAGFDIKLWPLEAGSRLFMDVMKCPTLKKAGKVSPLNACFTDSFQYWLNDGELAKGR